MQHAEMIIRRINSSYSKDRDIKNLIDYIARDKEHGGNVRYVSGRGVRKDSKAASRAMIRTQKNYKKNSGRRIYHWIISFPETFDDANLVKIVADVTAELFYEKKYQVYYGVHENTDNLHIHMAVNAVNFADGKKMHFTKRELGKLESEIRKRIKSIFL